MTNPKSKTETRSPMNPIKTLFRGKRKYAAIALALLAIPGSAAAAWMLTAHGQGAAKVGSFTPPTVTAGVPTDSVLPGGTTGAAFKVNNTNSAPLEIYAVADGNGTGSTTMPLCDAGNLQVVASTLATPIQVPPNAETTVTIPATFKLLGSAPIECAGATLTQDAVLRFRTT